MHWFTHEVTNQVPDLQDYNLFTTDIALTEGVRNWQADWHKETLSVLGGNLGSRDMFLLAEKANRHLPELRTHDRVGNRIDHVEYHASWHTLLQSLRRFGLHALPWIEQRTGAHVARAAGYFMHGQVEAGSLCPTTMTFAAVPVLRREPHLFSVLQSKLWCCEYDARDLPLAEKKSMLIGMGMTEKQGGSDVRGNMTVARPAGRATGRGAEYLLTGHKWFFSAPMCDAHLVLACTDAGLSCFYLPRWRPDGSRNAVAIQRLKDKLGNRSNASSEVEFQDAWCIMVGEEGRGIPTIIEMAAYTRLDCVIGSSALMRQALVQAIHHARHRHVFGRLLAEQPLMRNVLADLALESEAATLLMLRLAHAFDAQEDALQRAWSRVVTPAAKFWICKRAVEFTGECMEVWGGNGYVETGPMARLFREAPVNSIWEGSGNVMCLDVLRAAERNREGMQMLLEQLDDGGHPALRKLLADLRAQLALPPQQQEIQARRAVQQLVLAIQCSLLLQHAPLWLAEAFIASRLDNGCGRVYGTLEASAAQQAVIERAWPT